MSTPKQIDNQRDAIAQSQLVDMNQSPVLGYPISLSPRGVIKVPAAKDWMFTVEKPVDCPIGRTIGTVGTMLSILGSGGGSQKCKAVLVIASPTNAAAVRVANRSGSSTSALTLLAGSAVRIPVPDASLISFQVSVAGDAVEFIIEAALW